MAFSAPTGSRPSLPVHGAASPVRPGRPGEGPNRQWPELQGSPHHRVSRLQTRAASAAAAKTLSIWSDGETTMPRMVAATAVPPPGRDHVERRSANRRRTGTDRTRHHGSGDGVARTMDATEDGEGTCQHYHHFDQ